ncbi:sugar ABC transporter ATP-binding protein [Paraburkholderia metrosideri]|uniref:Vitamin B12 import ATP-binding protein BtuD n=1 Tax=Paraburkholderia metrosideri TaxID=580937 RepID=A0ABN7I0U2_9BURK|nr:sugar ABC transporter ATP-binding protein [Paraburkholderia metrosideri]CAD6547569.1 Vitamin B12 import ATP-binding protein BtuD [Paraburkholderia metrosideri]
MDILIAEKVDKRFGPVRALTNARLRLRAHEIHSLVGVNGAGKSTLSKIISGHYQKTSGEFVYEGNATEFTSPRHAMESGVSIVLQETSIAPDLSVLENLVLPRFASSARINWRSLRADAAKALAALEVTHLALDERAGSLSMANRQMVEIARATLQRSKIFIFDEPTASLSPGEVQHLFRIMRKLRDDGSALMFVSHRLEELFEISDCFTIMREGSTVESDLPAHQTNPNDLVERMVGRRVSSLYAKPRARAEGAAITTHAHAKALLEARNLSAETGVKDVSFTLERGKILGLGGLVGAGRTETLETLFGLRKIRSGEIRVDGTKFVPRHPRDAVAKGMALLTEDRRSQGLVPDLSLQENLTLPMLGQAGGRTWRSAAASAVKRFIQDFDMPAHVVRTAVTSLSGGQQQKMLLARWLLTEPKILLLDEPTRGIDIGTRSHIYSVIRQCAEAGMGIVIVSSDFEELLGMSDEVLVLSDGRSIASAGSDVFDPQTLTMFAAPRSSSGALRKVIADLPGQLECTTYWIDVVAGRVFCFDLSEHSDLPVGISRNAFPLITETAIPCALSDLRSAEFRTDEARRSILFELANESGHSFGWLGMTFPLDSTHSEAMLEQHLISAMQAADIHHLKLSRGPRHA